MVSDAGHNHLDIESAARLRPSTYNASHLFKLFPLLTPSQPAIFEDIAQESITYCRASLVAASDLIASKNTGAAAKLDGQLFLIRHLLILKEMTGHLNLAHHDVYGALDFKQVTGKIFIYLSIDRIFP